MTQNEYWATVLQRHQFTIEKLREVQDGDDLEKKINQLLELANAAARKLTELKDKANGGT